MLVSSLFLSAEVAESEAGRETAVSSVAASHSENISAGVKFAVGWGWATVDSNMGLDRLRFFPRRARIVRQGVVQLFHRCEANRAVAGHHLQADGIEVRIDFGVELGRRRGRFGGDFCEQGIDVLGVERTPACEES